MKKVRDNASGAMGGLWVWKHHETGFVVRHSNYKGCRDQVKIFLKVNNFPIGSNFEQDFEENLCANGDLRLCEEFIPPTLLEKMSTFAQALYKASKQWRQPLVDAEELERRRNICAECSYYGGSTSLLKVGCQRCGCSGMKLALASQHCPLPEPRW